jgi:hypothetical protein
MPTDSSPKFTPTHRLLCGYPEVAWEAGIEIQLVRDETARDKTMLFVRADGDQRWLASYDVEPLPQPEDDLVTWDKVDFVPTHQLISNGLLLEYCGSDTYRSATNLLPRFVLDSDVEPIRVVVDEPTTMANPDAKPMPVVSVRVNCRAQLSGDGYLTADVLIYALGQLPVAGDQVLTTQTTQLGTSWRVDVAWVTTEETGA